MMERRESDEKIASSKSKRTIAEAKEGREAKKFDWWQKQADMIGQRPMDMYQEGRRAVDDPQLWAQWYGTQQSINNVLPAIGAINQMPYQMPMQQGGPPAGALPGTGEAANPEYDPNQYNTFEPTSVSAGGYQNAPGAADGGPIQVPAQQALPAQPQAQPAQMPPQQEMPSRRERYNEWYGKMERMSFLNGGMEGLSQFREMEDATSRRQALGYAQQSATAMNEGMVGEAMRLGNSALESLSFDSGMEFVAQDGKLHLKGRDGSLSGELKTQDLMGFVDQYMKTPEQYLDWKKAEETQRSNEANEALRGREAAVSERQMTLDEELEPRKTAATEATALAALRNSDAALARAMDSSGDYGWDANNALRIGQQVLDWSLNDFTGLSDEVDDYYDDNQQEFANLKSGVAQIMVSNPFDEKTQSGYVDPDLAATVYQLITLPGGMDMGGQSIKVGSHPDAPGEVFATYEGKTIRLPPQLHDKARALNPEAFKQQGALPGANTQTNPSGGVTQSDSAGGETQSSLMKFSRDQIRNMDAAQVIRSGETWAKNGFDVQDVVDKIIARGATSPLERKQMQEMLDGLS